MNRYSLFAFGIFLTWGIAAATGGDIRVPHTPVLVEPDTTPQPSSETIGSLSADQWYVIESSTELITLTSPEGHVDIEASSGPIKVRGMFVDGTGKTETRTYNSPYVYFVTAKAAGTTELILIPHGLTTQADIVRQVLVVSGVGPRPGPDPKPDDPVVPPVPGRLKIMIIEDPSQRAALPASQIIAMDSQILRDYAKSHCTAVGDTPDFRLLSLRQNVSGEAEWIKAAFNEPRTTTPFIVVSNGAAGYAGPLPKTLDETLTLLKKYGGP